MYITDIRTAVLEGNFEWILIRVYTDEGLVGLGESYWGPGVEAAVRRLKPVLEGESPLEIEWLYSKMMRQMSGGNSQAGTVVAAISGVEIALWDLAGKALGVPVYRLLGGKYREKVRVYADSHHGARPEPSAWADRAQEVVAKGFTALKFDIDNTDPARFVEREAIGLGRSWNKINLRPLSAAELKHMVKLVAALRQAVGDEVDLAIDAHWGYNTLDAIRMGRAFEPFSLTWLEDPVPPGNWEAMARVTAATTTPICTGENLYTRLGLRDLIVNQACDILHVDIAKAGGLLESKKIADMADVYFMPFAAHNVCSPIGTMAAVHVCATMRNFYLLEFHAQDVEWWDDLVTREEALIEGGYVAVPEEPGLGLELNEEVARAHLAPRSTYFQA